MQEIEAKFYVSDLSKIEASLLELGAGLLQPRVLETNIRFDLPGGGLHSQGRVLRLRRDTEAKLTYKGGGVNEQGVLSRAEIEFVVGDFEKAKQLLEALGYHRLFYYEKYRTTYALHTSEVSTHIMLDELPYGNFVEVEGESVQAVRAVADSLGLKRDRAVPTSYHVLFERLCARHPGLDPSNLSFAVLQGMTIQPEDLSVQAADG